ncbi:hypothetical protein QMP26_28875 [Enterocloster clostridioformis]
MRYEPEEFERLKDYVDEFMKRGPLGDIFTPFFYKPYPYNQTENVLDTLRFADARKLLIDYLYKVSRAKSIEVTRQTEGLIGELWEYGYPDKNREPDFLKNLAWDICRMTKSVDYWQWEAMRLPGESESDVVRRTYQEIKNPEKRREFMQFWIDYLERMRPKYELEIQASFFTVNKVILEPFSIGQRVEALPVKFVPDIKVAVHRNHRYFIAFFQRFKQILMNRCVTYINFSNFFYSGIYYSVYRMECGRFDW